MNPKRDEGFPAFPDLTLPEKETGAPAPTLRPVAKSAWREGERVLAPWEPGCLYAGVVTQIKEDQALIDFDDGDEGWVPLDQVRALRIEPGARVFCRRQMGSQFFPAKVLEYKDNVVRVRFEDNGAEEWETVAALRIPDASAAVGAAPTQVRSHLSFFKNLKPGIRVLAPWAADTLYAGSVDSIEGGDVHVSFDDGDRGWVSMKQLLPLEVPVGTRLLARWRMGAQWFPGTVRQVRGEELYIVYDDGDKEWIKPAALCIPCDPFGPNARPTHHGARATGGGNILAGWIIPVILGLFLVFARASCR